ncbi:MAG TPA: ERF family protein [Stellaceae bacterium]|nr:ERF family protein [Stellaceae bacterium]
MSDQPGTLAAALIRLQARLPRITKGETAEVPTKTGGKYTYSYASLSDIHDSIFPLLGECGLAWVTRPTLSAGGKFVLLYSLIHAETGEEYAGEYPLPEAGGSQALGSAITYARRYALTAVLGIAPAEDDDDGHAAQTDWKPPANPRFRKAQRSHGTPDDDPWYDQPAEGADDPGTISDRQRAKIMALFNTAGILARQDRLAYAMSKLDLPELASSNDLSIRQAHQLITCLESEGDS